MMHTDEQIRYFEDDEEDFTAVELLYEGRNISMVICLPNKYDGLEEMEKNMTATKMQFVRRTMYFMKTHLTVPKFKLQTDYSLTRPLNELGFKRMFKSGANLSDMIANGTDLVLDEIKHKATIEVNEQGSEAAALTRAIMMKSMPHRIPDPVFNVDHPFLFAIFDIRNSMLLFMGRISHFMDDMVV